MISFLNDQVRTEFHLLPLDRQKHLLDTAESLQKSGQGITVLFVDRINEKISELTVRIDQKFNHTAG